MVHLLKSEIVEKFCYLVNIIRAKGDANDGVGLSTSVDGADSRVPLLASRGLS